MRERSVRDAIDRPRTVVVHLGYTPTIGVSDTRQECFHCLTLGISCNDGLVVAWWCCIFGTSAAHLHFPASLLLRWILNSRVAPDQDR